MDWIRQVCDVFLTSPIYLSLLLSELLKKFNQNKEGDKKVKTTHSDSLNNKIKIKKEE